MNTRIYLAPAPAVAQDVKSLSFKTKNHLLRAFASLRETKSRRGDS